MNKHIIGSWNPSFIRSINGIDRTDVVSGETLYRYDSDNVLQMIVITFVIEYYDSGMCIRNKLALQKRLYENATM